MKLTKKSVKSEVETTETVCELTREEFDHICAKSAADILIDFIGNDANIDDVKAGLELASILAHFTANVGTKLFNDPNENSDKDEKEKK